jgi:serine/threonine protein kinase
MRPAEQREDQRSFGRYRLRGVLGEGGMGRLYVAEQTGPQGFAKIVALKRILPHLADSAQFRGLFLDEARVAARLGHPNIVTTYELGEVDGVYFMAMEYLAGEDLAAVLQKCGVAAPMPVEIAAFLAQQAASALHYAHQLRESGGQSTGLVHRDVNPSNIFVSYHGVAKLLDFGVVKAAESRTKTVPGAIKGKYGYCAPEQLMGEELDGRTDVFSLGVVLWECLAGRRLFDGPTDAGIIDAVRTEPIVPPSRHRAAVPPALDEIALHALERDRRRRYQSAAEMGEALELYLNQGRPPNPQSVGQWLETVFGAERASLKKAIGQGVDVEGALARLAEAANPHSSERFALGKSPTSVRPRALWSSSLEGGTRATGQRKQTTEPGHAPIIALGSHREKASAAPPSPSAVKPRSRAGLVLALAAGLGALGAAAYFAFGPGPRVAPASPVVATVSLVVTSEPSGAYLFVDGNPSGLMTPATLAGLRVGRKLTLRVDRPGYVPAAQMLEVPAAGAAPVLFRLEASSGLIVLDGLPARAAVYLDGSQVDPGAPVSASVGSHRLRVEVGDAVVYAKTLAVHGGEQVVHIRGERSGP